MRVVALLAAYNEERFIGGCLEHLAAHGVDSYVIDHSSTDRTVEIAESHCGRGLVGLERMARDGALKWRPILERKEELAATLDADWFLHADPDEIRLPPRPGVTLAEALEEVDRLGYDAVNFQEFTFVPWQEQPDHDHPRFQETMRRYYPFLARPQDQVKAWKRQGERIDLASSGGHRVQFPGLRMYPESFSMRHYLFLSAEHAVRKYCLRGWDPEEVADGWHVLRAALRPEDVTLLPEAQLRRYGSDEDLDPSEPWTRHPLFAAGA